MADSHPTIPAKSETQKCKLTDRFLLALKPAASGKRRTIWDEVERGLAVRVTDKGAISFIVTRRVKGSPKPVRITIGRYGDVSLADARVQAAELKKEMRGGSNPRTRQREEIEVKRRADQEAQLARLRATAHRFDAVAERYIAEHSKMRSAHYTALVIRKDLVPRWGSLPVTDIARRHVTEMLHDIKGDKERRRNPDGISYAASKALAAASGLFGWAIASNLYDGLEHSPTAYVSAKRIIGEKTKRDRVLDDDEIRVFIATATAMEYPWGPLARMLLLSACRLREIAEARWDEVDVANSMLVVPASRMKGKKEHSIPLTPAMHGIIGKLPKFGGGEYLFSSSGGRAPVGAFGRFKERLDAGMSKGMPDGFKPWVLHDLRRTARSLMSRAGIAPDIAEKCLAHLPGGIQGTYDRWSYLPERCAALEALTALIDRIVNPTENAVPLRRPAFRGRVTEIPAALGESHPLERLLDDPVPSTGKPSDRFSPIPG
jgi:integrase